MDKKTKENKTNDIHGNSAILDRGIDAKPVHICKMLGIEA